MSKLILEGNMGRGAAPGTEFNRMFRDNVDLNSLPALIDLSGRSITELAFTPTDLELLLIQHPGMPIAQIIGSINPEDLIIGG